MDKPSLHICQSSLIKELLTRLSDKNTKPAEFSELVYLISLFLINEALEDMPVCFVDVETPLSRAYCPLIDARIGFFPILRAGIPMGNAAQKLLPSAGVYHLGFRRDERTQVAAPYYTNCPTAEQKVERCIILDPMLATGGSAGQAIRQLKGWKFSCITFVGILASQQGLDRLRREHPDVPVFLAGLDPKLNDKGYIIPGLGDAGDRIYGT